MAYGLRDSLRIIADRWLKLNVYREKDVIARRDILTVAMQTHLDIGIDDAQAMADYMNAVKRDQRREATLERIARRASDIESAVQTLMRSETVFDYSRLPIAEYRTILKGATDIKSKVGAIQAEARR